MIKFLAILLSFAANAQQAPLACPATPQTILIVDFKSGWWAGDGGNLHKLILNRYTKDCPSVTAEYRFMAKGWGTYLSFAQGKPAVLDRNVFPARSWADYSQVWILSGSAQDDSDLAPTDAKFTAVVDGIAGSRANIFLGAGIMNDDHANAVSAKLGLGSPFASHYLDIFYPSPDSSGTVRSYLLPTRDLSADPLFAGIARLPDIIESGESVHSDYLKPVAGLQVLGKNSGDEPVIARAKAGERTVIYDAGIQRFYALAGKDAGDEYRYLQNIAIELAR